MVRYIVIASFVLLSACTPNAVDTTNTWVLPEGLKDCKVYFMNNGNLSHITVVRCPNSEVTTQSGGKHKRTVTIN